ncbi:MAG: polysaccharide biosynthesis protein [Clostridium sp.]|nr:polysaccharide biosynthesis protein [Clostridium sp.]
MGKKNKISNNFAVQATILVGASIAAKIIGMIYNIPFANMLSPNANGYYGGAQTVYSTILLIATFSIPAAVSKIMSERIEKGEYRNVKRIFNVSMIYVLVVGGIAALVAYFGAPYFVTENTVLSLRVLAPTIFLSGFLSVYRGYFQAYGNMVPTSVSQIIDQLFNAVFTIAAAFILMKWAQANGYGAGTDRYDMLGAAGGTLGTGAGVLAGLIYMTWLFRRDRKELQAKMQSDNTESIMTYKEVLKLLLMIATPIILSSFIYNVNVTVDMKIYQNIMKHMGMGKDVIDGNYGLYNRMYLVLANVPIAMAAAVASAVIPRVSMAYASGDKEICRHRITQSLQFVMITTIPCAVGFAVLGKPIVKLLYYSLSDAYTHMVTVMLLLGAFSIVLYGISSVLNSVLQGVGKVNVPVISSAVALVLHLFLLVPCIVVFRLGIYSLVLATAFYAIIVVVLNYHFIKKYLGFNMEWRQTVGVPLLSALVMGGAAVLMYKGLNIVFHMAMGERLSNAVAVLIAILFAVCVYFTAMIKIGGYTEEWLMAFPKGVILVKFAKKIHLLADRNI